MGKFLKKFLLVFLTIAFLTLISCGSKSSSSSTSDSEAIDNSVVSMPDSLKDKETASKGLSLRATSDNTGISDFYSAIPMYVTLADTVSQSMKDFIIILIKSGVMESAKKGSLVKVEKEKEDDITGFMVEEGDNGYENKITLYYAENPEYNKTPRDIIRYSIVGDYAKGQFLKETVKTTAALSDFSTLKIPQKAEISFDGTAESEISVEIKWTQDLSELVTWANSKGETKISDDDAKILDIFQPSKILLKAIKSKSGDKEYKIYGTSYHPTASSVKANFTSDKYKSPGFFKEDQCMYLFKAVSRENSGDTGSKVYLSFPKNDTTKVDDTVWTNYSVGNILYEYFGNAIIKLLNENKWITIDTYSYPLNYTQEVRDAVVKKLSSISSPGSEVEKVTNLAKSLKCIINPAFFMNDSAGQSVLIGTYDKDNEVYYLPGYPWASTKSNDNLERINKYSDVEDSLMYTPKQVVDAEVTIE